MREGNVVLPIQCMLGWIMKGSPAGRVETLVLSTRPYEVPDKVLAEIQDYNYSTEILVRIYTTGHKNFLVGSFSKDSATDLEVLRKFAIETFMTIDDASTSSMNEFEDLCRKYGAKPSIYV